MTRPPSESLSTGRPQLRTAGASPGPLVETGSPSGTQAGAFGNGSETARDGRGEISFLGSRFEIIRIGETLYLKGNPTFTNWNQPVSLPVPSKTISIA
jgi:hypothetical protein